jgi:hypothetical protein
VATFHYDKDDRYSVSSSLTNLWGIYWERKEKESETEGEGEGERRERGRGSINKTSALL